MSPHSRRPPCPQCPRRDVDMSAPFRPSHWSGAVRDLSSRRHLGRHKLSEVTRQRSADHARQPQEGRRGRRKRRTQRRRAGCARRNNCAPHRGRHVAGGPKRVALPTAAAHPERYICRQVIMTLRPSLGRQRRLCITVLLSQLPLYNHSRLAHPTPNHLRSSPPSPPDRASLPNCAMPPSSIRTCTVGRDARAGLWVGLAGWDTTS